MSTPALGRVLAASPDMVALLLRNPERLTTLLTTHSKLALAVAADLGLGTDLARDEALLSSFAAAASEEDVVGVGA